MILPDCSKCSAPLPFGHYLLDSHSGKKYCIKCHAEMMSRSEFYKKAYTAKVQAVDHPDHYGGEDNPYEAIKVIEAWALGFCLGNTVKYISRAGRKDPGKNIEDLKKARWYLDREIAKLERDGTQSIQDERK